MGLDTWVYYFLAVLVLTASPGPSVLLCLTTSVTEGFNRSVFTALGSLTAIVGVMTLSFRGLGVVIASSEIFFNGIKWAGAAYLIYLGYKAITSKIDTFDLAAAEATPGKIPEKTTKRSLYLRGFIVGASNPKAIVFFTALFPQFINPDVSLLQQYLVFSVTFAVMEISWLLMYAYFGSKSSSWLSQKGRAKAFNKITGGVFISAGVLLSTSNRTSV